MILKEWKIEKKKMIKGKKKKKKIYFVFNKFCATLQVTCY